MDILVEPWIRGSLKELARQAHGQDCAHVSRGVDLDMIVSNKPPCSFPVGSIILHPRSDAILPEARKPFSSICVGCVLGYTTC